MSSPVVDLLDALGNAFSRLGLRWYLFGAQAALLHGAARLTADVDVTVDAGDTSVDAVVAALAACGILPRVSDPVAFAERTRVIPMSDSRSGMAVDLVLAGPGPEELFFERAEDRVIEGVRIRVASAEDVVTMKLLAGRPKDVDDAVAILAAQEALDVGLVRETLRVLEQALARDDLLPELERALARARRGP